MEDRSTVTLDARNGLIRHQAANARSAQGHLPATSTGYEARLSQAFVDMAKGTVTSDEHVDVKLLNGTMTADRLRITGGGEVVRFEGNVVMNLIMDAADAAEPAPAACAEPPAIRQDAVDIRPSPPTRNEFDDDVFPAQHFGRRIVVAPLHRRIRARDDRVRRSHARKARCRACPMRCRAFRKIATSRSRSRRPRSRCATRKRKRLFPAT